MTHGHKNARQYGDQVQCAHCGKAWDVNDPAPPECTKGNAAKAISRRQALGRVKRRLGLK